jgi:acyl dehydratase
MPCKPTGSKSKFKAQKDLDTKGIIMSTVNKKNVQQQVGVQLAPTPWHTVTQEQINQFADCTLDHQFIHISPEAAAKTPFGGTIAHGFLTLSMLSHFSENFGFVIEGAYMGVNYGFDSVRFIAPVKVGKHIRAHAKILEVVEKKPGQFMSKTEVVIEIEGEEKPALKAIWIGMQMVK